MIHQRHGSTSSYTPILINPTRQRVATGPYPSHPFPSPISAGGQGKRLLYPYPLVVLAIADLAYTVHHAIDVHTYAFTIFLCVTRALVLAVVLGTSRRWRARGGWVAGMSVLSLVYIIFAACEGQLSHPKDEEDAKAPSQTVFYCVTVALACSENILFLLLLRLSPPLHRVNPLGLRIPATSIQQPTAFPFETETPIASTPNMFREDSVQSSTPVFGNPSGLQTQTSFFSATGNESGYGAEEDDLYDTEMVDDADSDVSSVSESSIIDLPPPASPSRIVPANIGANVNRGVDLVSGALDRSPVLGPIVRRTRSARFLGRSWGSWAAEATDEGESYGTFVQDQS